MAVVVKYTKGYPDPTNALNPYSALGEETIATLKRSFFKIAVANGDSIASVHKLGRIPSNAMVSMLSTYKCTAITGLTDYDIGFSYRGTKVGDALVNGQTLASAATLSMVAAIAAVDHDKRVWQLLGLTADPGGFVDLEGTMNAAATAAGTIIGECFWSVPGP